MGKSEIDNYLTGWWERRRQADFGEVAIVINQEWRQFLLRHQGKGLTNQEIVTFYQTLIAGLKEAAGFNDDIPWCDRPIEDLELEDIPGNVN